MAKQKEATATEKTEWKLSTILRELCFAGLIFIILQGTFAEAFVIPSESMVPTLRISDRLLVFKLSYGVRIFGVNKTLLDHSLPERDDIVVFTREDEPETEADESDINIIKRVIALPGETIEVDGTTVRINGRKLEEDYGDIRWVHGGNKDFGPVKVPPDTVLLLGDNRDQSKDSRYWSTPFLDVSRIKGRAFLIYWPRLKTL